MHKENGCWCSRALAQKSSEPDSLFYHRKVRPMIQKRSALDAHSAQRKRVAAATALRREGASRRTLFLFKKRSKSKNVE